MLPENASYPLGKGKEEHVVTVGVGPVRHRHPHPRARHHASDSDEPQRRDTGHEGEPMDPGIVGGCFGHSQEIIGTPVGVPDALL